MNSNVFQDQRTTDLLRMSVEKLAGQLKISPPKVAQLGENPIPKLDAVIQTLDLLTRVLFPGYRESDSQVFAEINEFLDSLLTTIEQRLSDQIARSLILSECAAQHDCSELRFAEISKLSPCNQTIAKARSITGEFLCSLADIRATLDDDVQAAMDGDPACQNLFEVILCYPGFHAVTVYRLANKLHQLGVPLLPRMMCEWVHGKTGIDIHPGATIGKHFFIDHGTGVVIGETCVIGDHVKIYQGVTLGALSFSHNEKGELIRDEKRHPTIEDRVVIYANATILGGDTVIGHNSVIGSSVWITESIAPHTTVVMEKPSLRMRQPSPPK